MATSATARHQGKKLFGRAFYESLGSPRYILAPMVDHSEAAWRMLTRSFIPDSSKNLIAYSPMLHSRLFSNTSKYRAQNFEPFRDSSLNAEPPSVEATPVPAELHLDGHPLYDRPLFVQFCSNSPDDLLSAAKLVESHCDAVDLNLGCPQGIARRGHYGAFLQEDWDLIYRIINKLHHELSIPITAKFRILETAEKTLEYAKMILSAGASIITVHGRQREQKGHNTGLADWAVLRYLRAHLPPDTVIFANGNVLQYVDLDRCLDATGADGVMSAEANLSDPTVFAEPPPVGQEGREYWRGVDGRGGFRMDAVLRRYIDIICKHVMHCEPPKRKPLFVPTDLQTGTEEEDHFYVDEPPSLPKHVPASKKSQEYLSINLRVIQSHLFHLLRPLVAKHTDIRDKIAKCRAGDLPAFEEVLQMVEKAVKQALLKYKAQNPLNGPVGPHVKEEPAFNVDTADVSSEAAIERCRRPWFICQPHIRPLPEEAIAKGAMTLSKKEKAKQALDSENVKAAGLHPEGRLGMVQEAERPEQRILIPQEAMVSG